MKELFRVFIADTLERNVKQEPGSAGLDLAPLEDVVVPPGVRGFLVPLGARVEVHQSTLMVDDLGRTMGVVGSLGVPCLLLPRSSVRKTPLRQSNSVGLIDANYRGELMWAVDNLDTTAPYVIPKGQFVCQLLPLMSLSSHPMELAFVSSLPNEETERGRGGFGSTDA